MGSSSRMGQGQSPYPESARASLHLTAVGTAAAAVLPPPSGARRPPSQRGARPASAASVHIATAYRSVKIEDSPRLGLVPQGQLDSYRRGAL